MPRTPEKRDAGDVRYLRRRPERELPRRGKRLHEHPARLDRVRDQALVAVALRDDDGRLSERLLDVAGGHCPRVAAVRLEVVMDERGVGRERRLGVDDHGQRLVVHLHELGRVVRCRAARRDDHGDTVADMARLVDGERVVSRVVRVLGRDPRAGQARLPLIRELRAAEGRSHTRRRERGGEVDVADARVRVGASDDCHPHHPRHAQVVHELALADEQLRVLLAGTATPIARPTSSSVVAAIV